MVSSATITTHCYEYQISIFLFFSSAISPFLSYESVESHSLLHGRPFPLKGRYFANIFIHFEPSKLSI